MRILLIIIMLTFVSCGKKEIYYTYKNTKIKRIDINGKTTFFYMKDGGENGRIWAEYSGINDGFSGYLQFFPNGKVVLLSGDGYFQIKDNASTYFKYRRIISSEEPADLPNVCEIWYPIETEKIKNKSSQSEIKIIY